MNLSRSPAIQLRAAVVSTALGLALLSGCNSMPNVQMAGTVLGLVLEASGVIKKDNGDPNKRTTDLSIRIFAGEQLNTTDKLESLSLVMKIYLLRSPERLRTLTSAQISTSESEKEGLGEDLVAVREIVVIPGKSYDLVVKVPGEATTIGIVGMFRTPFSSRWKLAFDAKRSFSSGLIVGAHSCALSSSQGGLITDISPTSVQSLVGVQCNTY